MHKERGLAQKIIVIRHLCPFWIFSPLLFGLAAEIEIGVQPPILYWPYLFKENLGNAAGHAGESFFPRCGIGENDSEENGGLSG